MKNLLLVCVTLLLLSCSKEALQPTPNPNPGPEPTVMPSPTPNPSPEPQEFYTGFVPHPSGVLAPNAPYQLATVKFEHPTKFSWVALGYDIPVRDQGNCGSCWAHSTSGALEWAELIFLEKGEQLSVQQLVSCDKSVWGCGGGYFADDYVMKNGLTRESDFPYTAKNSACKPNLTAYAKALKPINIGDGRNKPTVDQLKDAIMQYGPLSVTVAAGKGWANFKGGIMSPCTNKNINHMVIIFGWTKDGWLMRNSHGKKFGGDGNAIMPFGCDRIADSAATFLVKPLVEYK